MEREIVQPTHLIYKCDECGKNIRLPIQSITNCPECGAVYSVILPSIRHISRSNH